MKKIAIIIFALIALCFVLGGAFSVFMATRPMPPEKTSAPRAAVVETVTLGKLSDEERQAVAREATELTLNGWWHSFEVDERDRDEYRFTNKAIKALKTATPEQCYLMAVAEWSEMAGFLSILSSVSRKHPQCKWIKTNRERLEACRKEALLGFYTKQIELNAGLSAPRAQIAARLQHKVDSMAQQFAAPIPEEPCKKRPAPPEDQPTK